MTDRADDKAFREQVRLFLLNAQFDGRADRDRDFVPRCLSELRDARDSGALGGDADPAALAHRLGDLTRFGDPAALVAAQWALADELASDFAGRGFATLATFVTLRPKGDPAAVPLLAVAVRFHFRRAVEEDPRLFQGLAFAQLERIGKSQEDNAAALAELMSRYVERLETRLGELKDTALTTRAEVREIRESLAKNPNPQPPPLNGEEFEAARGFASAPTPSLAKPQAAPNSLFAHTGAVACLAVSPDGTRAVSGGADHGLWVWDLVTRREVRCLAGHRDRVCCVAFSPDGRRILSSGLDQTVRLWDLAAGLEMKCFRPADEPLGRLRTGRQDRAVRRALRRQAAPLRHDDRQGVEAPAGATRTGWCASPSRATARFRALRRTGQDHQAVGGRQRPVAPHLQPEERGDLQCRLQPGRLAGTVGRFRRHRSRVGHVRRAGAVPAGRPHGRGVVRRGVARRRPRRQRRSRPAPSACGTSG